HGRGAPPRPGRADRRPRHGRRRRPRSLLDRGLAQPPRLGSPAALDPARYRLREHPARRACGLRRAGTRRTGRRLRQRPRAGASRNGADGLVRALADGQATGIGDAGRPPWAGERRWIALGGAFLRGAPLVVLDEPTADLDPASADVVAEAVERLRIDRTVLLI